MAKKLVIYYSLRGSTEKLAGALAEAEGADLYRVEYQRPPSFFGAFLKCPAAMGGKPAKGLKPITADLDAYDEIVVMGPIWASHPAPPVNSILERLPQGKTVWLRMVSGGGSSNSVKARAAVLRRGCTLAGYTDLRADGTQSGN